MKPFTKQELVVTCIIFLAVFSLTLFNISISLRRARDAQRMSDLGLVSDALLKFQSEYGYIPLSKDGKILMCKGDNFDKIFSELKAAPVFDRNLFFQGLRPCDWGSDGLYDLLEPDRTPYMKTLPSDPKTKDGISYLYLSSTSRFQIYTYLEGEKEESAYDPGIVSRNLGCGVKICSFGKNYAVPLNRDIDEYEKELLQKGPGK